MQIFHQLSELKFTQGDTFLHFTGSMFGIGCSAFNMESLEKINTLKKRKSNKGYIVLIPNITWLEKYNVKLSLGIKRMLEQYWPDELSVVLEVSDPRFEHISQNGKVAFRIPTDNLLREFIEHCNAPIISTSVNESGEKPVQNLDEILGRFKGWFDFAILPKHKKISNNSPSTIISFSNSKLDLIRDGSIPFSEVESSLNSPQILFVCTGNTCRSPLAEYLAKKKIIENGLKFNAVSVGFMKDGMPISKNSEKVLALKGIDASSHVSTLLNDKVLRRSWLVLTMTKNHKEKILQLYPNSASKVYTLSEFAGNSKDIADPIGKDLEYYKRTFAEINEKIKITFEKIKEER